MLFKPTKIRSYLVAMRAQGHSAKFVLAGTGLNEKQLQEPALLIEPRQRERIIFNMLALTGNPALGLQLGRTAQPVDVGVLAYAQMSARSMRDALTLWIKYSGAVGITVPIRLDEKTGSNWGVVYDIGKATDPVGWFSAEEVVSMAVNFGPALGGAAFALRECTFAYEAPPHWRCYESMLGCPVTFGAPHTSMRPRSPKLDWTLPSSDPEFHLVCLRHLRQVTRQISHRQPITSRLRTLFLSQADTPPGLDQAAAYLGMSARSLRRHLLQERTHYQAEIDKVRLDLAIEYLRVERMPAKEVSLELGYRSVNAFRQAFKAWTGKTVSDFLADS